MTTSQETPGPPVDSDVLGALRSELAEMRAELDEVKDAARRAEDEREETVQPAIDIESAVTRRGWMKAAAAAAVGGVAISAIGSSRPVAASDPTDLDLGQDQSTTLLTTARYTGSATGTAFLFDTQSGFGAGDALFRAALSGWSGNALMPTGIYGYTDVDSAEANGVVGRATSQLATGMLAQNTAIGGTSLIARATRNGGTGVDADGGYAGVAANGFQYGVVASGGYAALQLGPINPIAPPDRANGHSGGSLDVQLLSDSGAASLWFCSAPGSPGVWQKLAGPSTAGAFHAIDPKRVYDSRASQPSPGILSAGSDRIVSVADGRDLVSGAVTAGGLVPDRATAVTYNLTITETVGAGFVAIAPANSPTYGASAINWSSSGTTIANAGVVKLDANRQVKVFGRVGATHFIVDVTGYYL